MKTLFSVCFSLLLNICVSAQSYTYNISFADQMHKLDQLSPLNRDKSCWIYSATIMHSWKFQASYNPIDVAKYATEYSTGKINYFEMANNNNGLPYINSIDFGKAMGWEALNYSPSITEIYSILYYNGPIFFIHDPASDPNTTFGHALVIIGLKSNNLTDGDNSFLEYFDPWNGIHNYMSFNTYAEKYINHAGTVDGYLYHYPN